MYEHLKDHTWLTVQNHLIGIALQYAQWIPNTNKIVYVYQNNIYIKDIDDLSKSDEQITNDGVTDTIYNGIPDWVYEEEILSTNKAMYFTKFGKRMAFAQFNDTEVEEFYYTKFGNPKKPLEHLVSTLFSQINMHHFKSEYRI